MLSFSPFTVIPALLFGIAASFDAFLTGIIFGMRRIRIPIVYNLLISLITLLGTCVSVCAGVMVLPFLPTGTAKRLGSGILILFGIFYMIKFMLRLCRKCPEYQKITVAASSPRRIQPLHACTLGLTLSLNNMGMGLSASLAGLSLPAAAIVTLFFSIIFLSAGNRLGSSRLLICSQRAADPLSGLLLILLGILQLLL